MTKTIEKPSIVPSEKTATKIVGINMNSLMEKYAVEAINNNITTVKQVMTVFVKVCHYDEKTAKHYTDKIHREGRAVCFWASKEKCENLISAFKDVLLHALLIEA